MIHALVLTGLVLGLDNLRVAVGLGMLTLNRQQRLKIALAFGLCETLAPLAGLATGNVLTQFMRQWAGILGFALLAGSALYAIYCGLRAAETEGLFDQRWVILGLPLSLSLDNLLAGAGLGILGLPVLLSAVILGAISAAMCLVGLLIGGAIARFLPARGELLSGLILLFLAVRLIADP